MSGDPKKSTPALETRIGPEAAGERVDRWLAARLERSRSRVHALLDAGMVQLGGRTLSRSDKGVALAAGQHVVVRAIELMPEPSDAPLTLAAQGHDWLIADKPAGLPVHPLHREQTDTLLNRVVARFPQIVSVGEGGLRSGVVHRLDVPTSGLVLFALTDARYHAARDAFLRHTTEKRYFALVHGHVTQTRRVELDLVVAQHRPARVAVVPTHETTPHAGVRRCGLGFEPIEHGHRCTLLDVRLETGFLHQIRVTLAHLGHPVIGDTVYGRSGERGVRSEERGVRSEVEAVPPRLMLHAHTLRVGDAAASSGFPAAFREAMEASHP